MNKEFNLDDFKGSFKETSNQKKDASSIQKMLGKSSVNNVKYLVYISIAEFVLLILFYVLEYVLGGNVDTNETAMLLSETGDSSATVTRAIIIYRVLYAVFLCISFLFILTFYKIYKNLNADQSIKSFTNYIISFRKKANYFIAYNVAVFIFFWFFITILLVELIKQVVDEKNLSMQSNYVISMYLGSGLIFLIVLTIIFLYYRYFWGYFLKRLKRNQQELEELE